MTTPAVDRFNEMRRAWIAAPFARVSLRGRFEPGLPLPVFDDSIRASAAVSAPT